MTLADLSAATGISVSTLSRLESGRRRPSLELLLPLARAHRVPLDELVGAPPVGDPRVKARPIVRHGRTMYPLTRQPGGLQAYKVIQEKPYDRPEPRVHEGYEWLYVLAGRLRLHLGGREVVLTAGEAAEFDTRVPHWFGPTSDGPVEFLSLFGPRGSACTSGPGREVRLTGSLAASDRLVCNRPLGTEEASGCRHGVCTRTANRTR